MTIRSLIRHFSIKNLSWVEKKIDKPYTRDLRLILNAHNLAIEKGRGTNSIRINCLAC